MTQSAKAKSAKADLDQDYLGAGFGRALPFGQRPALLIVDFVRAYLEPGGINGGIAARYRSECAKQTP